MALRGKSIFRPEKHQIPEVLLSYHTGPSISESYKHTDRHTHVVFISGVICSLSLGEKYNWKARGAVMSFSVF